MIARQSCTFPGKELRPSETEEAAPSETEKPDDKDDKDYNLNDDVVNGRASNRDTRTLFEPFYTKAWGARINGFVCFAKEINTS